MSFHRAFFQSLPKAELHRHLDGSLRPGFLLESASRLGVSLPFSSEASCRAWVEAKRGGSLSEYLKLFETTASVLQTPDTLTAAAIQIVEEWHREGILYGELRFAPELHTQGGLTQEEAAEAVIDGLREGERRTGGFWGVIFCVLRHTRLGVGLPRLCARLGSRGLPAALDLAGPENDHPASGYAEVFREAVQAGVPITIHAGEDAGPESMADALDQGATRLGHGVRLLEEWRSGLAGNLTQRLLDNRTCLELCPSSNFQTGAWKDPTNYPLARYLAAGLCVTINTDNTLISATDLPREWELVFGSRETTMEEIVHTTLNGFFSAFNKVVTTREWLSEKVFPGIKTLLGSEALQEAEKYWEERFTH